eukprot:TRINITY_DN10345_c0_g1_i3.p1 TRINITY_DN10345_c0_g1~~TRINITY_DN10345_c0_g1_i3.p1  ORF type:complete len:132 (-),score=26.96 TRINITY_DN10345_c0_g1_i3:84-479(-)
MRKKRRKRSTSTRLGGRSYGPFVRRPSEERMLEKTGKEKRKEKKHHFKKRRRFFVNESTLFFRINVSPQRICHSTSLGFTFFQFPSKFSNLFPLFINCFSLKLNHRFSFFNHCHKFMELRTQRFNLVTHLE